ncbi:MAG: BrnT family toxin [Chloroflexota bacterium]|nr:BrnT family toxin [Chloroflexota bacterium]
MAYVFEYDPRKARSNRYKHGGTFDDAHKVFDDPHAIVLPDDPHSVSEGRYFIIGYPGHNRLLTVCYTERGPNIIRLINARKATAAERGLYEESNKGMA